MRTRWRILVVADDANGESLAARLRTDGHTVDTTRSRFEALHLARDRQYHMYFVDFDLPETKGIEIISEIRRVQPEASVIVTSRGSAMSEDDFDSLVLKGVQKVPSDPAHGPGVMSLEAMEKLAIGATLAHTGGNIRAAAAILGIDRSTLYEKIRKLQIPRNNPELGKNAQKSGGAEDSGTGPHSERP